MAIPAALVGGPLYARIANLGAMEPAMVVSGGGSSSGGAADVESEGTPDNDLPGFGITLFTILLPLLIMVGRTIVLPMLEEGSSGTEIVSFIGNPITALLISVLFCLWSLGIRRGLRLDEIAKITDSSFGPIGGVLLIIGAGGGFNAVLTANGIGAGAIGLTDVADSLFWMVKEFLGMSVSQVLTTLTVATTIASVVGLVVALSVNIIL